MAIRETFKWNARNQYYAAFVGTVFLQAKYRIQHRSFVQLIEPRLNVRALLEIISGVNRTIEAKNKQKFLFGYEYEFSLPLRHYIAIVIISRVDLPRNIGVL